MNHLTAQHVRREKPATTAPPSAIAPPAPAQQAAAAATTGTESATAATSVVTPVQPVVVIGGVATHTASNNLHQLLNPGGRNKLTQCVSKAKE